jgi:putative addiction module component (TIGR02574 family)
MSDDLIAAVKALPIDEQRHIVNELSRHLYRVDPGDVDPSMTPELAAELDRRFESIRAHPERLVDWEDIKAEIAARRKAVQ